MKPRTLLSHFVVASLGLLVCATGRSAVEPSMADRDWQAYQDSGKASPPKPVKEMSRLELAAYNEQFALKWRDAAIAFIERHPDDPRRWEIVFMLSPVTPRFVKSWGPLDAEGVPANPVIDEAAAAAWKARVTALQQAALTATDVPEKWRKRFVERAEPKPVIYHPEADAEQEIQAALAEARKSGRHVLIQTGGQWCLWCIRLHKLMSSDETLRRLVNESYVLVHVNFSKENRNEKVFAQLEYPGRFGYPALVVLNADGRRLHTQDLKLLRDGGGEAEFGEIGKERVAKFLADWTAKAVDPATYAKRP
ncbi:MAG: thioredoxin family protein [Opitutaceae bacterium]